MENVVVLTAAGTSVSSAGRLMAGPRSNNLECLVLDAVEKAVPLSANAKAVINHRKSRWPAEKEKGPVGFEAWLSYVFNTAGLTASDDSPIVSVAWKGNNPAEEGSLSLDAKELTELQGYIEKAIFAECALQIDRSEFSGTDATHSSGHIPFLAKLIAREANLGRTHLFTLNYDTLFEQAIEELGIQYFDGFSGKANSRFDPAVYGSMSTIQEMSPKGGCDASISSFSSINFTGRSTGMSTRTEPTEPVIRISPSLLNTAG
ncbi:hypothetical protein A7A08_02361 [Methyloligella halotolerans]|uniref:Uncharacterized protein n=1 Tax=Methyloligella halotolerans TaxID=1177755 RepID=A0A1E2RWJ4_9HYPH|nr:hypothetical protein A7A08_02361 [Methyloligella halotolerans]